MKFNSTKNNLRTVQAEERRLQILDVALTVFASHGFNGTSIKDIAEAAGISQGLMYHYFASKEILLEEVVKQHSFLPQLKLILIDAKKHPVDKVFDEIANKFLEMLDSKSKLVRIFVQEIASNPAVFNAWSNLCREGVILLQDYLDYGVSRGELKPQKTEVTARCLFGMLFMYHFTQDVFRSSSITRKEFINDALNNILNGISTK
jgi:TetR/AcrR family transcriptional regulator, cholesterol catabolism regulator